MAKVTGPLHSTQATGTVDGLVYARNQYGFYTRNPGSWVDPNTASQQTWRDAMAGANSAWQTLASTQPTVVQSWYEHSRQYTVADKLGRQRRLDAKSWYIKQNLYRLAAGLSAQDLPPDPYPGNYYPEVYFILHTDGIYVDCWPRPTGEQIIYVSKVPYQSQARFFCPNLTEEGVFIVAATSLPYKLWTSAEVGSDARRWFFKWVQVDDQGSSGSAVYDWVDTVTSLPKGFYNVSKDTFIWSAFPDDNYGSSSYIEFYNDFNGYSRIMMAFSLTSNPGVSAHKCYLFLKYHAGGKVEDFLNVYGLLGTWNEDEPTWNDRRPGVPWNTAGIGIGSDCDANSSSYNISILNNEIWIKIDVTRLWNEWTVDSRTNYGLCMFLQSDIAYYLNYYSHDAAASDRPYLIALYG